MRRATLTPLRLPFPERSRREFPPGTVIAESKSGIDIATGEGVVRILSLQLPGGKRLTAEQFLNGRSLLGVQL
nr:hypothetical protein [Thiothrix subterranea]